MSRLSDIPGETFSIPGLIKRNHELRGDAAALLLDEAEAGGQEASRAKEGRAAQAISYSELYHVVGLLCDLLSQKFHGAHIGILGENSNEWFLAFLGILCSSSAAVPVEIELSAEEAAGRLLRTDCEAVFLSEDYTDYGEVFAARGIEVLPLTLVKDMITAVTKDGKKTEHDLRCQIPSDTPAAILFTSGTSGEPKAVVLSHKGLLSNVRAIDERIPRIPGVLFLVPLPLYHAFTLSASLGALLTHAPAICFTSVRRFLREMPRRKPHYILAVPAVVELIYENVKDLSEAQIKEFSGGRVAGVISGGAYLAPAIQEGMCGKGLPVVQGYGMTECSPIIAVDELKTGIHTGSVGRAIGGCTVSVSCPDENGVGELTVRGDNLMTEYYKDPEATAQTIRDGVLYTGDLGYLDENGYIYLTGRKKDLIILSNGKNVSPEELEGMFVTFPYIRAVRVYEEDGRITGEFALNKEQWPDAEERLKKDVLSVNRSLPKYKNIVSVKIGSALPGKKLFRWERQ